MRTQITARNFEATPSLRDHVHSRISKLEKYYDGIIDARITLTDGASTAAAKEAEITLNVFKQNLTASTTAESHEKAVDECVDRLRRQILKYKDKLRSTAKDAHR